MCNLRKILITLSILLLINIQSVFSAARNEKLPAYTIVDIFEKPANQRRKCSTVLGWFATKYPDNYVLTSLRNIIYFLSLPHDRLPENSEKELIAAFNSIQGTISNVGGLEPGMYISIISCSVDNNGRTILQKMVEHGMVQALMHTMSQQFWRSSKLHKLVDIYNNNLAHLVAMSDNDECAHYLLGVMFKSNIVADLLDQKNKKGELPIDIAFDRKDQQVIETFKNFYRVTTLPEREGFVDNIVILEDLESDTGESKKEKETLEVKRYQQIKELEDVKKQELEKLKLEEKKLLEKSNLDRFNVDIKKHEDKYPEEKIYPMILPKSIVEPETYETSTIEDDEEMSEQEKEGIKPSSKDIEQRQEEEKKVVTKKKNKDVQIQTEDIDILLEKPKKKIDKHFRKKKEQEDINWTNTFKSMIGAGIIIGISILSATILFCVCKKTKE